MLSSDQSASLRAVIAQEQASVAYLRGKAPRAWKVRWRALKGKHIRKREEELRG